MLCNRITKKRPQFVTDSEQRHVVIFIQNFPVHNTYLFVHIRPNNVGFICAVDSTHHIV